MQRRFRSWAPGYAFLLGVAGLALQAQQPVQIPVPPTGTPGSAQAGPGVLTLHASSRAVLLDVVVTDGHGHAVHGLKAQDFQLLEDGKPQTVASVEEHRPPAGNEVAITQPMPDLGPNTWTNFKPQLKRAATDAAAVVFLLDSLDTPLQAQAYVREQLLSYFNSMASGTQVAIFQMDTQLRLLQGFSSDPAVLRAAIKDRDKVQITAIPNGPQYAAQALRMDVLTAAMQSLGTYLETIPGRKNLIWFTAHIPRTAYDGGGGLGGSLHDSETFYFDYKKATDSLVLGQVSIYPVDSRGLETDPAFSAANSGLPARDSGARFAARQFYQHNDLDQVAEATGGKAFYNTNGIKQAVAEVVETGSSFYTLSFYPTNKAWDGTYRKLKLELAPAPAGAQMQYRRGYYALSDAKPTRQAPAQVAAYQPEQGGRVQLTHTAQDHAFVGVMQLGAVDPGQIVFKARVLVDPAVQKLQKLATGVPQPKDETLVAKYRDKPFRRAEVVYGVPGNQLQFDTQPDGLHVGHVEFVALVFDNQGALVGSSSATLEMKLKPDTFTTVMHSGLVLPVRFSLPEKGQYFVRVGVHDTSNGRAGALEVAASQIKIGDLGPAAAAR